MQNNKLFCILGKSGASKTINSIETGQFNPSAKLALILCIALNKKFEELFYFEE
ncbi:helix-turn-helix transcriptional regulator [Clostridium botulinum]|uniref:helix-turn-helix transcriptional regulator n=1 Tax=Clostridium botulinum TaxID=1491 RepID=UPI001E30D874|nr:transcriptional regulator [Clostridium botulinum]